MSRLSDRLFEVELDLAKNEGDDESAALSRRMVLREALTTWGDERWKEGYHEGRRDMLDARSEAQRRADAAASRRPEHDKNAPPSPGTEGDGGASALC